MNLICSVPESGVRALLLVLIDKPTSILPVIRLGL